MRIVIDTSLTQTLDKGIVYVTVLGPHKSGRSRLVKLIHTAIVKEMAKEGKTLWASVEVHDEE